MLLSLPEEWVYVTLTLRVDLYSAKYCPPSTCCSAIFFKRVYSLAFVPLKSPSLASISSSAPSVAFSITLLPPDLRGGAKDAGSFPLLQ